MVGVFSAPHTAIRGGQMEMRYRILRLHFHGHLERSNSLGSTSGRDQRPAQTDERVCKPVIESGGGEMLDGLRPLLRLTRQLSEHIMRTRVAGTELQLFLELVLCVFNRRSFFGFGEQQTA